MDNKSSYIQVEGTKFINEKYIVWVRKANDNCLKIGTIRTDAFLNMYALCKSENPESYNRFTEKLKNTTN